MKIKLLKEWVNGDKTWKVGSYLEIDEAAGKELIEQGIAEQYKEPVNVKEANQEVDFEKMSTDIAEQVRKEIKKEIDLKIPAQPKKESTLPWKNFGQFAQSVFNSKSNPDQKLRGYLDSVKATGMSEGVNVDGGFLIPAEFSTAILTAMAEQATLTPRCMNFPVNNNLELPFVNLTTQATSWTGGVTIYKPNEASQKTSSYPALAKAELKLHKMTALVYATDELIQDSPLALQTFLTTMVSSEFAMTKDEDVVNGSGAGEALGILNSPCIVSVAKETGQAATTIVYENVAKMWSRLHNPSRGKAVWLINQDCMEQISKLSIAVGTGGGSVMVVNAATQIPQAIFGAPIIWSPHCQTLGTTGDIYLADFSQYITISKQGKDMEAATSIHLKFDYDETAFRFVVRFDGQPWWSSARTPKHGTNTVSPFVKLDARA